MAIFYYPDEPTVMDPVAVDDTFTTVVTPATPSTVDVSSNDTACDGGQTTTYVLNPASYQNIMTITPTSSATGQFTVTPGGLSCEWSFEYEIYCDGTATGETATATGRADALLCGPNLISDPYFANSQDTAAAPNTPFSPAGWYSGVDYIGLNLQAGESETSKQIGPQTWYGGAISQIPFAGGDPVFGVAGSDTYYWANGTDQTSGAPWLMLGIDVPVTPQTDYKLVYYSSSGLDPVNPPNPPLQTTYHIEVNGADITGSVTERDHIADDGGVDRWHRHEYVVNSGTSSNLTIEFINEELGFVGNDLMLTAMGLHEVLPCPT